MTTPIPSRRQMLTAALAAAPVAIVPALASAGAAAETDPVIALIERHKALSEEHDRLCGELSEAEYVARKTHGTRPYELISWRYYWDIG
jgi:hypothetical protein